MGKERSGHIESAFQRTTWGNTTSDAEEWQRILASDDEERKQRLFQHLFFESPDGSDVRNLFSRDEIREYLSHMVRPVARAHVERRRKVWRRLYCGTREPIPELDWRLPSGSGEIDGDGAP
ncbi:MAG: hypothetical protein WD492_11810 [Alkalispirochaeta sp.]